MALAAIQQNKEAAYARARAWGHSENGRVMKALKEVLEKEWPAGTNVQIKWYEKFIGMKYGARDKCMDDVVDCAELPRIGNYIFHGFDEGNFTDAQFYNKRGVLITERFEDIPKCRQLDQPFYKTNSKKRTGHTSMVFDTERIFHSGAKEHNSKVNYSKITWGKNYWKTGMCVKRFLSDEQFYSVIVGGAEAVIQPQKIKLTRLLKFEYAAKAATEMRKGAGSNYAMVKIVPKDARVTYMVKEGSWLKVYYNGQTGYVQASKMKRCDYLRGEDVKAVQAALGFVGKDRDGVLGPMTAGAISAFQTGHGLEVDAIVGPITWAALGL